ncbi:MAG: helix-turn-helix domain-containing protein [Planctomycetaceae bacterium]|nr:helix-turn-helix domain-containing protein [Planctomycetaceae bacterium]
MTATIAPPRSFLVTERQDVVSLPLSSDYTVSEAAEILDMPEECLNDLIRIGVFECRQENGERFILRSRVLEFDRKQKWGEEVLKELSRLDQEMGLYD